MDLAETVIDVTVWLIQIALWLAGLAVFLWIVKAIWALV